MPKNAANNYMNFLSFVRFLQIPTFIIGTLKRDFSQPTITFFTLKFKIRNKEKLSRISVHPIY